ncbi:MAG: anthrone oxygenase family protein [Pseudomonadota bacterium]
MQNITLTTLNFSTLALFGLIAGFFYAFSVCVMPGLNRIQPTAAIAAMQAINEAVRNPVFFVTFFLTPVFALASAIAAYQGGQAKAALVMAIAAAAYFTLALLLTARINVPMNEGLAVVDATPENAQMIWDDYSNRWTLWNTARTLTSLASMLIFAAGMIMQARPAQF